MKKLKLIFCIMLSLCLVILTAGCSTGDNTSDDGKIQIVSTVFPPYDFARQIAKDKAEISILLPPGNETHTYEPSPSGMIKIKKCDIFLYIGGENELWAQKLIDSTDMEGKVAVKLIDKVGTLLTEEEHSHGDEDAHDHEFDQHIWTSPARAMMMCDAICEAICTVDSENAQLYKDNNNAYKNQLTALQGEIKAAVDGAENKEIVLADKFPFRYFADEFGLSFHAAFPGCSDESEPGAQTMAALVDLIKEKNIKVVYYLEFSSQKVADALCNETGAEKLMLHSCHNVSAEDLNNGETYISLMTKNLEALKRVL